MTIAEYLRELEARLPSTRRRRFLAEAEEHLRDAARTLERAGLDRESAERRAVAAFGPPDDVARRLAAASAGYAVRRASIVGALAACALVLPLYGVPENTLPPATWSERPLLLGVLVWLGIGSWLVAVATGALAVAAAQARLVRAAVWALVVSATAVAVGGALGLGSLITWLSYADTRAGWTPLLVVPLALACTGLAAACALWARGAGVWLQPDPAVDAKAWSG